MAPRLKASLAKLAAWLRAHPKQVAGVGGALMLVLGGGGALVVRSQSPVVQARALVEAGKPAEALKRIQAVPADEAKGNEALQQVRAMALHAQKRHNEEHAVLAALEREEFPYLERREAPRATVEQLSRAHSAGYVMGLLRAMPAEGLRQIDADTVVSPGSGAPPASSWRRPPTSLSGTSRGPSRSRRRRTTIALRASPRSRSRRTCCRRRFRCDVATE